VFIGASFEGIKWYILWVILTEISVSWINYWKPQMRMITFSFVPL
jgi:hypothetical protein